jgi:hypothetical protein
MLLPDLRIDPRDDKRVREETRMVRLVAWIYAVRYEGTNDWRLQLGNDPHSTAKVFINGIVSGLPIKSNPTFDALRRARQDLVRVLDYDLPAFGTYRKYNPPIPVQIEGALYFSDAAIVPPEFLSKTRWEIRPISKIEISPAGAR